MGATAAVDDAVKKASRGDLLATLTFQLAQLPLEEYDFLDTQIRLRLTETKVLRELVESDVLGKLARKQNRQGRQR